MIEADTSGSIGLQINEKGDFNWRMSVEDRESLLVLDQSSYWKTYRKVLLTAKEGYQLQMLQMDDPSKISKTLGIIVGLNLAINQLGALVAQFKQQAERVAAEPIKQTKPTRQ